MLYDNLEYKRKQLKPTPPRPYNVEHNIPIRLASGVVIPVPDEATEEPEPEESPVNVSPATTPISDSEAASENIQIEQDPEPKATTVPKTVPRAKDFDVARKPQTLIDAEEWALAYRAAHPTPIVTKSPNAATFTVLRTYALWHFNPLLSVTEIGTILRDPPLQPSTVMNYILDAVRVEKLPYNKDRLKAVLQKMPDAPSTLRFRGLRKLV
jgi:exonuclease 3'-5' domain-containing protein 2